MKFRRLRVAHYRGVGSVEVDFNPSGITLIRGPNEAGKSSLGEAIGLVFDFPDSSKHRAIEAIRPVHRDEGPEIELEAESGSYLFTYFKRFHKKPETRLTIQRPRAENLTGREAHERAEAVLRETLDIDLWKALTLQQGEAIQQPVLAKQISLSSALDRAAGGRPADPREEGLFDKAREEYSLYYTERGAERRELKESRQSLEEAKAELARLEQALGDLERDIEREAALQRELAELRRVEEKLAADLAAHAGSLAEIEALETALAKAKLKLEAAEKSALMAHRDREARQELLDAVESALKKHAAVEDSRNLSQEPLRQAEEGFQKAQAEFRELESRRGKASELAALRRADFDHFNDRLHLEQLRERKERIDQARRSAAEAEEALARNRVEEKTLKEILDAERACLSAAAKLEAGAPAVRLRGLAECRLAVSAAEIRLGRGEVRTIPVAGKIQVTIPDLLEIEIAAGEGAADLADRLQDARRRLDAACAAAGVADPEAAAKAFDERNEALRRADGKARIEKENLRDLSYEQLEGKLRHLERSVPEYLSRRPPQPAICADLESANRERADAEAALRQADRDWGAARAELDAARVLRDDRLAKHQEAGVQLQMLLKDLKQAREKLERARAVAADEALEAKRLEADGAAAEEKARAGEAESALRAKNPEKARALAAAAKGSLQTAQNRRAAVQTELTQVQTRLKIHGEDGLHEKLRAAQVRLERVEIENQSLLRRAAAARRLFEVLRDERDKARRAYLAPLKSKVEGLGRLVFDETFQVEINEELMITQRTLKGIAVPFESLSGGTREQLSLILRLACSMIAAGDGGAPLILDDALGYTDPERLRCMGAVLARAARECQIVIFTCVPERYVDIGEARVVNIG